MEEAPIPDTSSSQWRASFHGFGSEDMNCLHDKMEQYLNCPTALTKLILPFLSFFLTIVKFLAEVSMLHFNYYNFWVHFLDMGC